MKSIAASELQPVTSKDVQILIRQLRVVITNARIYEAGHAQRVVAHRGVWDLLFELSGDVGRILIEIVPWGPLINGKGLETEDKGARLVTAWFQERVITNIVFDGRGRFDEFCVQMDALTMMSETDRDVLRLRRVLDWMVGPPLFLNVVVDHSAPVEGEDGGLSGAASKGTHTELGRQTTKVDALAPGDSGDAQAAGSQGGWSDRLAHLNPASPEDGEGASDVVEENASVAEDSGPSREEIEAAERAALIAKGAEAVCAFLSVPLPGDDDGARRRRTLLTGLQQEDTAELRTEVLGLLSRQLGGELTVALGSSLLQACEELVSATIDAGSLHTVAAFCEQLDQLTDQDHELAGRAGAARVYMSSPELIEKMVRKMEVLPKDQCDLIRKILRGFGHSAMPQLFELMMTQERKSVRLSLAEVMNYHLREADSEVDLDELTAPLLRELSTNNNPWYVKRNVVYILGSVRTPVCQRALLRLAGQDEDPRVLTEVARGLLNSTSDVARSILGKLAWDPRFSDAAGLFEVIRALYPHSPERVLAGLEQRLGGKDVTSAVAQGTLLGLVWSAEQAALPFLSRILTEQKGGLIKKRPLWSDTVRAAALEALATMRGQDARAALQLGREDKVSAIRRLAVELMHMEPSRAAVAAYGRIGVRPGEDEK